MRQVSTLAYAENMGLSEADELQRLRARHLERIKAITGSAKADKQLRRRLLRKVGKLNARIKVLASGDGTSPSTSSGDVVSTDSSTRAQKRKNSVSNGAQSSPVPKKKTTQFVKPPKKRAHKTSKRTRYLNQQIAAYAQRKELKKALEVFEHARSKEIADVHTYTNIINAQIRCGQLEAAERNFNELLKTPGLPPNVVSFTVMLKGYAGQGLISDARKLIHRMSECHPPVPPNLRTANTFIRGCLRVGAIDDAEWALHRMLSAEYWGLEPDRSTYTAVVSLMCQSLRFADAARLVKLLASMPDIPAAGSGSGSSAHGPQAATSSGNLSIQRLHIQVARAAVLCGQARVAKAALDAAAEALQQSSHLKEKMETRRARAQAATKHKNQSRNKRRQQSADLFRKHQLREEQQTFRSVCTFAINCGVPIEAELLNSTVDYDADLMVKPTSSVALKATANKAAAAAGKQDHIVVPDLLPHFCRIFSWPPAPSNARSGDETPLFNPKDPVSYADKLVAYLGQSFGLNQWAALKSKSTASTSAHDISALVRRQISSILRRSPKKEAPFQIDFDQLFRAPPSVEDETGQSSSTDRLVDIASTPLKLEIGAGTGEWAIAQAHADHDSHTGEPTARWTTLELRHDRVYETFANSVFEGLDNLCLMRGNAQDVVRDHFASELVSRVFVNHPEPPERTMALVVNNKLLSEKQGRAAQTPVCCHFLQC